MKTLPLFDGLSDPALKALMPCIKGHTKKYKKGEILSLEEDKIQNIGIVLEGIVFMIKEDYWGNETIVAYEEPGQLFGETFAVKKETRAYVSFKAASDCTVLYVSFERVLHTCQKACPFHQRVIENMIDEIGNKNIQLMEKIEVTTKTTLREKILTYLSIQAQKQGKNTVELVLNRSELAAYLSSNRSAMTRELSQMRDEGLIDFDRNTFRILKSPDD